MTVAGQSTSNLEFRPLGSVLLPNPLVSQFPFPLCRSGPRRSGEQGTSAGTWSGWGQGIGEEVADRRLEGRVFYVETIGVCDEERARYVVGLSLEK